MKKLLELDLTATTNYGQVYATKAVTSFSADSVWVIGRYYNENIVHETDTLYTSAENARKRIRAIVKADGFSRDFFPVKLGKLLASYRRRES